jgi:hypothetical protein
MRLVFVQQEMEGSGVIFALVRCGALPGFGPFLFLAGFDLFEARPVFASLLNAA